MKETFFRPSHLEEVPGHLLTEKKKMEVVKSNWEKHMLVAFSSKL